MQRKKHKKIEIEVENSKRCNYCSKRQEQHIIMLDNFSPNKITQTIKIHSKN